MAYCVISDVTDKLGEAVDLGEDMKPSRDTVTAEIDGASADVDLALEIGDYTLPVSNATHLTALKKLVAKEVAFQVRAIRGVTVNELSEPTWRDWHKEFLAALESMRKGEFFASVSAEAGPESHTMNAEEDETDPTLDAVFQRGNKY